MPLGKRHLQQKQKNYLLLIIMLALVALFFALPFIKLG